MRPRLLGLLAAMPVGVLSRRPCSTMSGRFRYPWIFSSSRDPSTRRSERPYRSALEAGAAFDLMETQGLDPLILAAFRAAHPSYAGYRLPRWAVRWLPD